MRVGGVAVTMLVVSFVTIAMFADAASRETAARHARVTIMTMRPPPTIAQAAR